MRLAGPLGRPDDSDDNGSDDNDTGDWRSMAATIGVIVSLMLAATCAWSLTVEGTATASVVEVVEVAPISIRRSETLRVTWVDADGRRDSYQVPAGTEIQPGDQLTVTRSDLVDDVVRIEWESGRLDLSPIGRRTAVAGLAAALIVGTTAGVAIVRRRR